MKVLARPSIALIAALCLAGPAWSTPPTPADSGVPCGITLVGTTGGVADMSGAFLITIRDIAHYPVPNANVAIDFHACQPDIRVSLEQPWPGLTVECTTVNGVTSAIVHGTTDANGGVWMRIVGGAHIPQAAGPAAPFKCARVTVHAEGYAIQDLG